MRPCSVGIDEDLVRSDDPSVVEQDREIVAQLASLELGNSPARRRDAPPRRERCCSAAISPVRSSSHALRTAASSGAAFSSAARQMRSSCALSSTPSARAERASSTSRMEPLKSSASRGTRSTPAGDDGISLEYQPLRSLGGLRIDQCAAQPAAAARREHDSRAHQCETCRTAHRQTPRAAGRRKR